MAGTTILALAIASQLAGAPRLYAFRDSPSVETPLALVVEGASWQTRVSLPNLVFALDHPEGLTLVDAGYGSRFAEYRRTFPASLFYAVARIAWGPPRPTLPQQLRWAGLDPARVRRILVTHAHFDHVGGLVDFPRAEVIMTRPEGERFLAQGPAFLKSSVSGRLRLVDLATEGPLGIFPHAHDLYRDGSVTLLAMPGHTPGHMGVFVRLGSGRRVLLAGDTAWVREHYVRKAPRGWPTRLLQDAGAPDPALGLLHHLHQLDPALLMVPSHDPEVERVLPHPPDGLD